MLDLKNIPEDPGCYLYKDKANKVIYVGKAKSLKKRVKSYFTRSIKDEKTKLLVAEIANVEYFVTNNEVEALILENNLIRKYRPKYNIDLKDSRRYAFIAVTDEEFPRLSVARDKSKGAKYYGPFVNAEHRDNIIKLLRASFMVRTCNKLPKRACLRYHINLCSAPCINKISKEDYGKGIKDIESFLKGHTKELLKKLNKNMKEYSSKLMYEQAKIVRDQIKALEYLSAKQKFELDKGYDEDIINFIVEDGKVYLIVFNAIRGMLASKHEFSFDYTENFLEEFVKQYYSSNPIPKEIILPVVIFDNSIIKYLEGLKEGKVNIIVPKIGPKLELVDLVRRNVEIAFFKENKMVMDLRDKLKLNSTPSVIECFDIAHLSGTSSVGSMVQFRNAKPDKSNYRRFKIKTVDGNDDFASIKEVVHRRYSRLKAENSEIPDLIVIDGGKGQLSVAVDVLRELELKIPVIALAKKFEEIFVPGLSFSIKLKKGSPGLNLLVQIRDEAHRFAQKYHKLLRSKKMVGKS